jgi:hypothetical protein
MTAIRVKGTLHCGQVVMSIANTRLSNGVQLMRAPVEVEGESPGSWEAVAKNNARLLSRHK